MGIEQVLTPLPPQTIRYSGNSYYGDDQPRCANPIYGFRMLFQLRVLSVCNGSKVLHTSKVLAVDFGKP